MEAELNDSRSKIQVLSDREDFLLAELAAQVHDLDCKFLLFFVLLCLLFALLFLRVAFAGIQNNAAEENRIVEDELQQLTACSSSSFWSNLDKSRVLLTLRTRVKQVSGVMGLCHAALCNIYGALFPLNKQPKGIFAGLRRLERARLFGPLRPLGDQVIMGHRGQPKLLQIGRAHV